MRSTKSQPNAGESSREDRKRRRAGRGWGPFSGGQLTMIVIAVVVTVGLPVGAFAVVQTSKVAVTDSATGKTAAVNAKRQLSVAATGLVTATPTPPNSSYTKFF